jgi:autotransporter-associated beta strand protein
VVSGGGGSITKSGLGTLALNGNNTFTGGLSVGAGTVNLGNAGALNSTGANAVSMTGGTLDLKGYSVTGSSLSGSDGAVSSSSGAPTFTVNQSGDTSFSGILGGSLGLTKSGPGTLTLNGASANTYSGATVVNGGALDLAKSGALGSSSGVTVNSGAALKLSAGVSAGSVPVTLNGGTLNANNQSATFSSLGVPASGSGTVDLAAGQVGSTLNLGTVTINISGTLTIANWGNGTGHDRIWVSSVNNLSAINFYGFSPGAQIVWGQELAPAGVTVVPEPRTYGAVFALGLVGAVLFRRWKAAKAHS